MPSFEEEAFERARKMSHSRRAVPHTEPKSEKPERPEKPEKPEKHGKPEKPPQPQAPAVKPVPDTPNLFDTLLRDKETSLILILLLLLMDEKNDPTLIFSLMYLLM